MKQMFFCSGYAIDCIHNFKAPGYFHLIFINLIIINLWKVKRNSFPL